MDGYLAGDMAAHRICTKALVRFSGIYNNLKAYIEAKIVDLYRKTCTYIHQGWLSVSRWKYKPPCFPPQRQDSDKFRISLAKDWDGPWQTERWIHYRIRSRGRAGSEVRSRWTTHPAWWGAFITPILPSWTKYHATCKLVKLRQSGGQHQIHGSPLSPLPWRSLLGGTLRELWSNGIVVVLMIPHTLCPPQTRTYLIERTHNLLTELMTTTSVPKEAAFSWLSTHATTL